MEEKEHVKKLVSVTQHRWNQENIDDEEAIQILLDGGLPRDEAIRQIKVWRGDRGKRLKDRPRAEEARERDEDSREER